MRFIYTFLLGLPVLFGVSAIQYASLYIAYRDPQHNKIGKICITLSLTFCVINALLSKHKKRDTQATNKDLE
jgi:riboflavin transporter FmnP